MFIDLIPVVGGENNTDNVIMRHPDLIQLDSNPSIGSVFQTGVPNKVELELPQRKILCSPFQVFLFHFNSILISIV